MSVENTDQKNKSWNYLYIANIILVILIVVVLLTDGFSNKEEVTKARAEELTTAREQTLKEVRLVSPESEAKKKPAKLKIDERVYDYIEVTGGCWPSLGDNCTVAYGSPNALQGVPQKQLRKGTILKVGERLNENGEIWYKVTFEDEWIRYPERVTGTWYVRAQDARLLSSVGPIEFNPALMRDPVASSTIPTPDKLIIVDRSDQKLYAYEGDELFTEQVISTGLNYTPTPRGTFRIFKKIPSRYMQGPLPGISAKYYDLPGVPWNMYFTEQGGAIHGAYWHDSFGQQWSSGCVNVPLDKMEALYKWADLGTTVVVRD